MKLFTLSQICTSQKHCQTCRAQEKGRLWRQSLAKAFELPLDAPDFACPPERGAKPWGYRNPSLPPKTPQNANGARPAPLKPDASVWGPPLWAEFHRATLGDVAVFSKFLQSFNVRVPCGTCRSDWLALLGAHPPDLSSSEALFAWGWMMHSKVRERLKQTAFSYDDAVSKYGV